MLPLVMISDAFLSSIGLCFTSFNFDLFIEFDQFVDQQFEFVILISSFQKISPVNNGLLIFLLFDFDNYLFTPKFGSGIA